MICVLYSDLFYSYAFNSFTKASLWFQILMNQVQKYVEIIKNFKFSITNENRNLKKQIYSSNETF